MRIKICGITQTEQAQAIVQLGATALGFICVPESPRYIEPAQILAIIQSFPPAQQTQFIGVFLNASLKHICRVVAETGLTGVQLHGTESPEFCYQLKVALPQVEIIKALRIHVPEALSQANFYQSWVDTLLLDAYHPELPGGTGRTLEWTNLGKFKPECPWFLAGGLTPENIEHALSQVVPDGIDLSSGVERAPGDKDLDRVAQLFVQLQQRGWVGSEVNQPKNLMIGC